jgi:hypothetical protein
MKGERRRRQVLHRQARELVYKVFSYFKHEADAGMPVHEVAKAQERTAEVCDVALEVYEELLVMATSQFVYLYLCAPPAFVRERHFSVRYSKVRSRNICPERSRIRLEF